MTHFRTLKEICVELKISRRTVQWYENKGLIKPTSKNKYGYLLFDDEAIARIALIRFGQSIGLTINEIGNFIDGSVDEIKEQFTNQVTVLLREKAALEVQIKSIEKLSECESKSKFMEEVYLIVKGDD